MRNYWQPLTNRRALTCMRLVYSDYGYCWKRKSDGAMSQVFPSATQAAEAKFYGKLVWSSGVKTSS